MHAVTGSFGVNTAEHLHSKQRKIADNVHDLVPHELIGKSKPFTIQDSTFGCEHNRVLERATTSQTQIAQSLNLLEKPKGPSRRDLF